MLRWVRALGLAVALAACARDEEARPRSTWGDGASRVAQGQVSEDGAAPTIPADAPLVAFLGDSISAGLHLSGDEAFPAVLQRKLAAEGQPFQLINAGVSGDTTAGGLRRLEWLLARAPDVVVVELGGNDGLRGQDLAAVERNLRAIVETIRAKGARALLLEMKLPPSLGAEYTGRFEALYARVAAEADVPLVTDFLAGVGGVPAMNLEDGLHPTAEGHRRLAANVAPQLSELLRKEP
ncbi:MAG: arylesterase [Planctomycetes bacterium]|nr:arylesterase [Planctomycetota bacterium]